MQFLTPLFWLGAAALVIPIVLHLVRREKDKRLPFASLMFIRRVPIKELNRRRLQHLLLLFLRCLGLVLLVFAFARPVLMGSWLNRVNPLGTSSTVILIDHSLSMSPRPIWESVLGTAASKIESLSDDDEALIIQFAETAEVLSRWESSPTKLKAVLESRVSPSFESTSYVTGLRAAVEQFGEPQEGRKTIYLITDLQRAGLGKGTDWKMPDGILTEIEDVGRETPNLFIEEVRLERDVFTAQHPYPILVRVAGSREETTGEVQLFVEGKMVDRKPFELSAEGNSNLTFKPFDIKEGTSRGRIVVEPDDLLPTDNVYHFVIERKRPQSVVVLGNRKKSALYLEHALSSGSNLPFVVRTLADGELADINGDETSVVVLNDVSRPPKTTSLENFVEEGGGLILTLGSGVRAERYRQNWDRLLPAEMIDRRFLRRDSEPFTSITDVNWDHPIFTVFQDPQKAGILRTQFYSYWRLSPKEGATVLARFDGGDPALVEKSFGNGRILIFASSLDSIWTDFPLRNAYVPFWHRLVQYAGQWHASPAAVRVNQVLPIQAMIEKSNQSGSGTWNIIDPRGHRVIRLDQEDPHFVSLKRPGHYEIRSNRRSDWVAVNCPTEESKLDRISIEEFQAALIPRRSRPQEAGSSTVDDRHQQSLWWLLLLLAAAVFMGESLVANRTPARMRK